MPLFGFPMFNINKLIYSGFELVSDTVNEYTPSFLEMIGIKHADPNILSEQHSEPVDLRLFGASTTMSSEQMDARYDQRQPAIEALQRDAKAMGLELPKAFVDSIYNCTEPTWTRTAEGIEHEPIFNADGSLNPKVHNSILSAAKSGDLQIQAAERHREGVDRVSAYGEDRSQMLDKIEQSAGVKLDTSVRQELDKTGVLVYNDQQGHRREIDIDSPNAAALVSEIKELTQNFMHGQAREVDFSDVAVHHAQAVYQRQEATKGRA